jgi:hypothetical protein
MRQHQEAFDASIVAELNDAEIGLVRSTCDELGNPKPASVMEGQFVFFAAFDGTNNDRGNLALSGTPQQTNVAQLSAQVDSQRAGDGRLRTGYFAGVGTGGERGDFDARSSNPTPYIMATAEQAYQVFAREASRWLEEGPPTRLLDGVCVAVTGFSRGAGTAIQFARLVNDRGLQFDGKTLMPPLAVRVAAALLLDPVFTKIDLDLTLPPNLTGHAATVQARHEYRYMFRAADYSADARIRTIDVPGNHGNVGGMYDNGIGALVLQGATGFFRACGVSIADVPEQRRFDAAKPVRIYSEGVDRYQNRIWSESGSRGATRLTSPVNAVRSN